MVNIALTVELVFMKIEQKDSNFEPIRVISTFIGLLFISFFRVIFFPFFSLIVLLAALRQWLCLSLDLLIWNGELIVYKTVADSKDTVTNYLKELIDKDK